MDNAARSQKEKQLIAACIISLVIFAAGWLTLPILSAKILLAVVLLLIAGTLFFSNDTGR